MNAASPRTVVSLLFVLASCLACNCSGPDGPPEVASCEDPVDAPVISVRVIDAFDSVPLSDDNAVGFVFGGQGSQMFGLAVDVEFADVPPSCFQAVVTIRDEAGETRRTYSAARPTDVRADGRSALLGTHWDTSLLRGVFDVTVATGGESVTFEDIRFGEETAPDAGMGCVPQPGCGAPVVAGSPCRASAVCADETIECRDGVITASSLPRPAGCGSFLDTSFRSEYGVHRTPDGDFLVADLTVLGGGVSPGDCALTSLVIDGVEVRSAVGGTPSCDVVLALFPVSLDDPVCGETVEMTIDASPTTLEVVCD